MRSVSRIRSAVRSRSGHDFQNFFVALLGELLEGTTETKKLGRYDRSGVDGFVLSPDGESIETMIQCKGFEEFEYGTDQHKQCRTELRKFIAKGPPSKNYWLVLNRPITKKQWRDELLEDLAEIVRIGKTNHAELLDQEPLATKLSQLSTSRLEFWAEAKRIELFDYYSDRMQVVQYIPSVPFETPLNTNPVDHLLGALKRFFDNLREHQTGKHRYAPKFLVTSEFGFGKTSTLQTLAVEWVKTGRHLVYAPAALLAGMAFSSASGLADSIITFLVPEDEQPSEFALQLFRDTLRGALVKSKDWLLLIDGLDENETAFKANTLQALRGCIADLGIPAVLSARDELVESRLAELFPATTKAHEVAFDRIRLVEWPHATILKFIELYSASKGGNEPPHFQRFRTTVEAGQYEEIYGDIPKRPLFLGMLVEDAWAGNEPETQLHRLYGKYFRQKLRVDRLGVGAGGTSGRPSTIVDSLGLDEATERLINVMQDVADQMLEISGTPGSQSAIHHDTITERALREIVRRHDIPIVYVEDVAMHSLLQPAGRDAVTRGRVMRFAHRSFQDWFLARQYAAQNRPIYQGLPRATLRFLGAMTNDLRTGRSLP